MQLKNGEKLGYFFNYVKKLINFLLTFYLLLYILNFKGGNW